MDTQTSGLDPSAGLPNPSSEGPWGPETPSNPTGITGREPRALRSAAGGLMRAPVRAALRVLGRGCGWSRLGAALVGLIALGTGPSCTYWVHYPTQKHPDPMETTRDPLPPGEAGRWDAGPEEVTIVRHSDPVQLQPPGALAGFPLSFHNKQMRMNSGTQVLVEPYGRAEVLWPNGSSAILGDKAVAVVGSPSRGESTLILRDVSEARFMLHPGDEVRLLGGAILRGESGPYRVERTKPWIQRVQNQSKGPLEVVYRDETFELGPGQRIDLAVLGSPAEPSGTSPMVAPLDMREYGGAGFPMLLRGEVESERVDGGAILRGSGNGEVRALGIQLRLGPGDRATLSELGPIARSSRNDDAAAEASARASVAPPVQPNPGGEESDPRGLTTAGADLSDSDDPQR